MRGSLVAATCGDGDLKPEHFATPPRGRRPLHGVVFVCFLDIHIRRCQDLLDNYLPLNHAFIGTEYPVYLSYLNQAWPTCPHHIAAFPIRRCPRCILLDPENRARIYPDTGESPSRLGLRPCVPGVVSSAMVVDLKEPRQEDGLRDCSWRAGACPLINCPLQISRFRLTLVCLKFAAASSPEAYYCEVRIRRNGWRSFLVTVTVALVLPARQLCPGSWGSRLHCTSVLFRFVLNVGAPSTFALSSCATMSLLSARGHVKRCTYRIHVFTVGKGSLYRQLCHITGVCREWSPFAMPT